MSHSTPCWISRISNVFISMCVHYALCWTIHSTTFSMIEHLCRCAILCKYVIWKLAVWHVDYVYTCWKELILFIHSLERIHWCIFHVERENMIAIVHKPNQSKSNQVNHVLHINGVTNMVKMRRVASISASSEMGNTAWNGYGSGLLLGLRMAGIQSKTFCPDGLPSLGFNIGPLVKYYS